MFLGRAAGSIGRGLFAGLIGTAAMTISSTLEMKLRGRESSDAPVKATEELLGVEPKDQGATARWGNLVHWGYGTALGGIRGAIGALGLRGPAATVAHFAAVWGAEAMMLPKLDVAPPLNEWGGKEMSIDAFHHAVYATTTGLAYDLLERDAA